MVSDGKIGVDVEVTGAAESEEKLRKVAKAAKETGESAGKAGGLFSQFERATKSLDDAVDKVEKPMRTFSGAVDIASVALGVGLAGPLGQVIQQLVEMGKALFESGKAAGVFAKSSEQITAELRKVGDQAKASTSDVEAFYAQIQQTPAELSDAERILADVGATLNKQQKDRLQKLNDEALQALGLQLAKEKEAEEARKKADELRAKGRREDVAETTRLFKQARAADEAAAAALFRYSELLDLRRTAAKEAEAQDDRVRKSLGLQTRAEEAATKAAAVNAAAAQKRIEEQAKAREQAAEAYRRAAEQRRKQEAEEEAAAERRRKEDEAQLLRLRELGKEAAAAIADINAANDRASLAASLAAAGQTVAGFLPGLDAVGAAAASGVGMVGGVVDSAEAARQEEEAGRARRLQAALDGDAAASLAIQLEQQGAALKANFSAVTQSALDLQSVGVSAVKGFADAVGQALANLIITGGKFGQSFKKVAGEVAASLASQSLSYSVFLGAAAIASAFSPGLLGPWWNPATLGAASAAMAAVGVTLGLTARALGAGKTDAPSGGGSAGAGGGGDRTASYSAPGQSSPSMNVTVVLGVEQVSDVLVRQSQRESRSGSLASSRLAVA